MKTPLLYISHDAGLDHLHALEFGVVPEGHPNRCWMPVTETFAFWRPSRGRKPRGFVIYEFSRFDETDPEIAKSVWDGPRFRAPIFNLEAATVGEIVLAARAYFGDRPSLNRVLFNVATGQQGEEALETWQACLEAGDRMAHFAIGYTLFELERFHEAYGHLRTYTELSPNSSWNWCWFGKAARAIGELDEAESAFRRAIELTRRGDLGTDADGLLAEL